MKEHDVKKAILMKRLVKYFFDELKYRMKIPCLRPNNKDMSKKYILLNLLRKIASLPFNKQYEIEEQFPLDISGRGMLTDAVLIKRLDYERCIIAGIVEAKADHVDLEYELSRFLIQSGKINVLFWQPRRVILKQDEDLIVLDADDIFNLDNDFYLPVVKEKLEDFINIFMKFFSYEHVLFEYNKMYSKYSLVKNK
ncbi:hypothetical protein baBA2_000568 [Borrelia anserina]|uniref:Uncharacterized protein n=2 Tax=Borrelia anserina TaxID=143 RepID=W5SU34_BORAN|nr:hypothetical protein [Borrelia anserina]AHH08551.1 Hypothetical protein BAN_0057300 [Borrelia anserina BA2]APR65018.1 hypothetical protein N187_02830 [Borrelia anserina Es]UPA06943.1 hypothetical protein baBA2_000568 [Borrelia anserina]